MLRIINKIKYTFFTNKSWIEDEGKDRRWINKKIYTLSLFAPLEIGIEIRNLMMEIRHTFLGRLLLWKNYRFITRWIPFKLGLK